MTTRSTVEPKIFTAETLRQIVLEAMVPPPEDPLNGATVLWVHRDDTKAVAAACALRDAANPDPLRPGKIHVHQSPNALYGRIYGFVGNAYLPCLEIKMEGK